MHFKLVYIIIENKGLSRCHDCLHLFCHIQTHITDIYHEYLLWNCPHKSATILGRWLVNIGSSLVWFRLTTSHYLNQCWLRSVSPHGVPGPQWVNNSTLFSYPWVNPHFMFRLSNHTRGTTSRLDATFHTALIIFRPATRLGVFSSRGLEFPSHHLLVSK